MLVLSRKEAESIMIGDDVEICVIEIRGNKVKLGIVAPRGTTVHRQEIWVKIQAEKAAGKERESA